MRKLLHLEFYNWLKVLLLNLEKLQHEESQKVAQLQNDKKNKVIMISFNLQFLYEKIHNHFTSSKLQFLKIVFMY